MTLETTHKESFRPMWRLVGDTLGRDQIDTDLWVDKLFEDWDSETPTIIDDVRYPNEAQAILSRGGLVFSLERIGQGPRDEVPSEQELPADLITETIRFKGVYEGAQLLEHFIHEYHRQGRTHSIRSDRSYG